MSTIKTVKPSELKDSPFNPRKTYDPKRIASLGYSMQERISQGLPPFISRPKARQVNGHLELVVGHRRKRAAIDLGLDEIEVEVVDVTDAQAREEQLVENNQREDVHPIEEVETIVALMELGHDAREVAAKLGFSPVYVHQRLRLANLCEDARRLCMADMLTIDGAFALARVAEEQQHEVLKLCLNDSDYDLNRILAEDDLQIDGDDITWRLRTQMPVLDGVGFPLDEKVGKVGPCTSCPKRASAQTELFADALSDRMEEERCSDSACFQKKLEVHWPALCKRHKSSGVKILKGKKPKLNKTPVFNGVHASYDIGYTDTKGTTYIGGRPFDKMEIATFIESKHWLLARDDNAVPHLLVRTEEFDKKKKEYAKKHGLTAASGGAGKEREKPPAEPDKLEEWLATKERARVEREDKKASKAVLKALKSEMKALVEEDSLGPVDFDKALLSLGYGIGACLERRYGALGFGERALMFEALNDAMEQHDTLGHLVPFMLALVYDHVYDEHETSLKEGYILAFCEFIGINVEAIQAEHFAPLNEKREKRKKRDERKVAKARAATVPPTSSDEEE